MNSAIAAMTSDTHEISHRQNSARRGWLGCVAGLALALPLAGCSSADPAPLKPPSTTTQVKVLTRNLYLGADLNSVASAGTTAEVVSRASELWSQVLASKFSERARVLAQEIKDEAPDLIGLQEVELFRTQTPSDFNFEEPKTNASQVSLDFLSMLLSELDALGLHYSSAIEAAHTDTEVPAVAADGTTLDVRLTDRDAILVKDGVNVLSAKAADYPSSFSFKVATKLPVVLSRGLVSIEASVNGARFTFANTHLEVGGGPLNVLGAVQENQAKDLLNLLAPVAGPVILVGDFNSPASGAGTRSYETLTKSFRDAHSVVNADRADYTCCTELSSPASTANQRIDLVLTRGDATPLTVNVIGVDPQKLTPSGLWPSDHAGVAASLNVPISSQ